MLTWNGTLILKTTSIEKNQSIDMGFEFSSQNDPRQEMDGLLVKCYFEFDSYEDTKFIGHDVWSPKWDEINNFTILNDKSSIECNG